MIRSTSGAALVVVLVGMLALTTAVCGVALTASRSAAFAEQLHSELAADQFLLQSEKLCQMWLELESRSTSLPPQDSPAQVELLDWAGELRDHQISIQITAFDQNGMVGIEQLTMGSALRFAVPRQILSTLDQWEMATPPVGLDDFSDLSEATGVQIFPRPDSEESDSLGEWAATHKGTSRCINISTAPISLVRQAYKLAGLGSPDLVVQAREAGELPMVPSAASTSDDSVLLVNASDSWAFRIDLGVDSLRKSWWAVFSGSGRDWTLVQRLPFHD